MNLREIDQLIATEVMGWRSMGDQWATGPRPEDRVAKKTSFKPTEYIQDAWLVVEELEKRNIRLEVGPIGPKGYFVSFIRYHPEPLNPDDKDFTHCHWSSIGSNYTEAETIPHALLS